jgi:hypothetical protein
VERWLPFSGLMGDKFIHDVRNIEDSRERGHIEKGEIDKYGR